MWIEVLLLALLTWYLWRIFKKPSNYPPGPWGLPLIGYFPSKFKIFEEKLIELRDKHNGIFSWRVGSRLIVFLSDYKTVKEAFQSQAFTDRPDLKILSLFKNDIGIVATNGLHWHNIRRFTFRHLRDLGMGKSKIVSAIQYEAMELVKVMKRQAGRPAPFPEALKPAVINVLWQMLASKRYELDDEKLFEFNNLMHGIQESIGYLMIGDIFPWVTTLLPKRLLDFITKKHKLTELAISVKEYFQEFIDEHKESLDSDNPRDFIDAYLIEMEKQKSDPDSTMSKEDLIACISDLFGAGMETTSATIVWSVLYLASFPEVQNKLQREIDDVLPEGSLPTLDDKSRLPYTEAFINEVLRYSSITPLGVPHSSSRDVALLGYIIPKGSFIVPTTEAIHFEEKYFDSPKEFNPGRFLNSERKFESTKDGFLPFGTGKRQCIGESLARMQLFIFLTIMVQHLSFSAPSNGKINLKSLEIPLSNQPDKNQDMLINIRK